MKLTCVTATFNVIAAGNRERLIRCVESVAKIPVEHEHLIYDGASTDGTAELLRELEKTTPGLRVVSEPDTGIYNALNKGVRDAKGEWFYVLGCDDVVFDVKAMGDALLEGERSAVRLIFTPIDYDTAGFGRLKWGRRYFMTDMPYPHQGMLIKTDLLRSLAGFDESFPIAADFDLMQRLLMQDTRHLWIDRPFARFGVGGVSTVDKMENANDHIAVVMRRFGLTETEGRDVVPRRLLPFRVAIRHLVRGGDCVRHAAFYQLMRWGAAKMGIV